MPALAGAQPRSDVSTVALPERATGLRDGSLSPIRSDPAITALAIQDRPTPSQGLAAVPPPLSRLAERPPEQTPAQTVTQTGPHPAPPTDTLKVAATRTAVATGTTAPTNPDPAREADEGRQSQGPAATAAAQGSAVPSDVRAAATPTSSIQRAGGWQAASLTDGGLKDGGLTPNAGSADPALADPATTDLAVSETRSGEGRGAADPSAPRTEHLPRATAAQIADVARRLADGPVEVSLSPEELGRVRLSLHGSESQMTVQIMAERPETLDLLRRHIDLLAAELRQQGFADLTFSFSGGGAGGAGAALSRAERGAGDDNTGPDAPATGHTPDPDGRARAAASGAGLDLRL